MNNYLALIAGVIAAGAGSELFVRGTVRLAHRARVSTAVVGVTVAAFATSSSELAVALGAAARGIPQVSFGDVLGSNVVNIALVLGLGIALARGPVCAGCGRRDAVVALLAPIVTGLMLVDGRVSRFDGLLLLGAFVIWLAAVAGEARRQRDATPPADERVRFRDGVMPTVFGLGLLLLSGYLIVSGARGIARALGVDEFIIGATIVAGGTSVPELATLIVAHRRGHDEIGLGMMLGSNVFNGLFIAGLVAVITPFPVAAGEVLPALVAGVVAVALVLPGPRGVIGRGRAIPLFVLYTLYVVVLLQMRERIG